MGKCITRSRRGERPASHGSAEEEATNIMAFDPLSASVMRFLADQDVYAITIQFLSRLGHDVTPAADLGLARPRTPSCFVLPANNHERSSRATVISALSSSFRA